MRSILVNILKFFCYLASLALIGACVVWTYNKYSDYQDAKGPNIDFESFLVINLNDTYVDSMSAATAMDRSSLFAGSKSQPVSMLYALKAIQDAQVNPAIKGIFIYNVNKGTDLSYAGLSELRNTLVTFKTSKKPIFAYLNSLCIKDYYLCSLADRITIHPMSIADLTGISMETSYLGNALKQYGIGVQVGKAGRYKSFPEQLTQDKMSPEDREQRECLLNTFWNSLRSEIQQARSIDNWDACVASGLLNSKAVLDAQLVDAVEYLDETVANMRKIGQEDSETHTFKQISLNTYANNLTDKQAITTKEAHKKLAVIYIEGMIVDGIGTPKQAGSEQIARDIAKLRFDKEVAGVLVRVNSPGGSAFASERIQRELSLLKKEKPLVVSMSHLAASGGYWVSTEADAIFATPYTITGSIGAFSLHFDLQKIGNEHGVTWDTAEIGKYANISTISRPKTPEELALIDTTTHPIYQYFLEKVASGRKLSLESVEALAEGRIWSGIDAKEKQLVTHLGSIGTALDHLASICNLPKNYCYYEAPEPKSSIQKISELIGNAPEYPVAYVGLFTQIMTTNSPLAQIFQKVYTQYELLSILNDRNHVYTLMPYTVNIQ